MSCFMLYARPVSENPFPTRCSAGNGMGNRLQFHTFPPSDSRRQRTGIYIILRSNIYTPKGGRTWKRFPVLLCCRGQAPTPTARPCPAGAVFPNTVQRPARTGRVFAATPGNATPAAPPSPARLARPASPLLRTHSAASAASSGVVWGWQTAVQATQTGRTPVAKATSQLADALDTVLPGIKAAPALLAAARQARTPAAGSRPASQAVSDDAGSRPPQRPAPTPVVPGVMAPRMPLCGLSLPGVPLHGMTARRFTPRPRQEVTACLPS